MFIEGVELTSDEVEEIELTKELCDGTYIGEEKITCFEVLSNLFNQTITIKDNRKELIGAYLQLIQYNKFWSGADWFNNEKCIEVRFVVIISFFLPHASVTTPCGFLLYINLVKCQ